jgi:DNA (cytosine-5)-methyltransferase 1
MHELALFAGAGGGILGGKLLGWKTVCAVEINDYARRVLLARQDDGCLEPFPIWDDVRTFDGRPWRGLVDVVSGGFPCQDISPAGNGEGLDGERSGLWREMRRIVGEVGPRFVLVENSPALTFRGLGTVLSDLAALGYDARWGVLGACHAGAPHERERIWIVADANRGELRASGPAENKAASTNLHQRGAGSAGQLASWWAIQPEPCSVAHGMAGLVDELRPFGNGQVPHVVRLAWSFLAPEKQGGRVGLPNID